MSRAPARKEARAGFTLIEVLVALSILAVSLSAIGGLLATSVRGARSLERHLTQIEIARGIAAALPDRDQLALGNLYGAIAGHRWRVDVSPFIGTVSAPQSTPWVPQAVVVTVQSPEGGAFHIDTVRLQRRGVR